MPTLILNDVPQALFDNLLRRATADQSSIPEVTLGLLHDAFKLTGPAPTVSDAWQIALTCGPRYPDWILHEEISAPFDLPFSTPGTPVQAVDGPPRLPDPIDIPSETT